MLLRPYTSQKEAIIFYSYKLEVTKLGHGRNHRHDQACELIADYPLIPSIHGFRTPIENYNLILVGLKPWILHTEILSCSLCGFCTFCEADAAIWVFVHLTEDLSNLVVTKTMQ